MTRSRHSTRVVIAIVATWAMTACGSESNPSSTSDVESQPATTSMTSVDISSTMITEGALALALAADVTEGLVDQQTITVTGSGGDRNAWVVQCDIEDLAVCWTGTPEMFDTFGTFSGGEASIELRRIIPSQPDVDCAERPGRCVLRLAVGDEVALVPGAPLVELTFDPDEPTRSALQLTVTPDTGLVDNQTVAIEVANFPDSENLGLGIQTCTIEATPKCVWLTGGDNPPVNGVIRVRAAISRLLVDPGGQFDPVDCAVTACAVRVRYPGSPLAEVALEFDTSRPAPDPPRLELLPTDDPRTSRVLGQGLTSGVGLMVMVCLQTQQTCAQLVDPIVAPDPSGRIDTTITLPEETQGIACLPGSCAFSVASSNPTLFVEPVYATG